MKSDPQQSESLKQVHVYNTKERDNKVNHIDILEFLNVVLHCIRNCRAYYCNIVSHTYKCTVVIFSEGGSSTDTDEDEEDEGSRNPSSNTVHYTTTSLADDHAASLLLNSEQGDGDTILLHIFMVLIFVIFLIFVIYNYFVILKS